MFGMMGLGFMGGFGGLRGFGSAGRFRGSLGRFGSLGRGRWLGSGGDRFCATPVRPAIINPCPPRPWFWRNPIETLLQLLSYIARLGRGCDPPVRIMRGSGRGCA